MSHRGWWHSQDEKNDLVAFRRTLDAGYGTETDVRDLSGQLVVSHDPPKAGAMHWEVLLDLFDGRNLPLAVNVKADGLGPALLRAFEGRNIPWFTFDMSVPQMVRFAADGLPFYTRHSDVEPDPVLYTQATGVWLDAFHSDWYSRNNILRHLESRKSVCIVSPELHGREHREVWDHLRDLPDDVTLCTDLPDHANRTFHL